MRLYILILCLLFLFNNRTYAQFNKNFWESHQLLEPEFLAQCINEKKPNSFIILSVGPDAVIKNSIDIGPTDVNKNVDKLHSYIKGISKNKEIVIYCGCCPLYKCPNVRPAFNLMKEMGFKNVRVLNLKENIKVNWLDKNYPTDDN